MYKKITQFFTLAKIQLLLKKQFRTITTAALVIGITSLASRFLGLIRDHMLANKLGAGNTLDIYYAAFRIPDLLYNLLVLGALSAGFIPVFTSYLSISKDKKDIQGNQKSWELVNIILHILLIGIGAMSILLIILTPYLMQYIVPGFSSEELNYTIKLTQLMFLSPIFLSISSLFGGILQSFKRFLIYSLAPILYNIGIILGVVYFYDIWGLYGLGVGVIFGAFFHMIIQIAPTYSLGYKYKWIINVKHVGLKKIIKMMIPRTMGLAVIQLNLVVITIIASTLSEGSLTIFNFANNLQTVPIGLFGIAFAIAAFPTLSQYADKNKWKNFSYTFASVCKQIIFFIIPITFLFIILRAQIVRIVLGSGAFDWQDTILTFQALGIFSVSLFAQSLIPLLARTFYTVHDSKTPFVAALFAMFVNIILSIILSKEYGVLGLVWAFTISAILQFIILWVALHSRIGNLEEKSIIVSGLKIIIASTIMAVFVQGTKELFSRYIVNIDTVLGILTQTVIAGMVGIGVFIGVSLYLRSEEMLNLKNSIKKKLFRKIDVPQAKI